MIDAEAAVRPSRCVVHGKLPTNRTAGSVALWRGFNSVAGKGFLVSYKASEEQWVPVACEIQGGVNETRAVSL
jgi:hypothetical protein